MSSSVKAYNNYTFSGKAGSSWEYVTDTRKNYIRPNSPKYFGVSWKTSDSSTSHKMWFRLVNSNGSSRGSACLNYLSSAAIDTTAEANHYYWLQAKREYIIDPKTTVTGDWSL